VRRRGAVSTGWRKKPRKVRPTFVASRRQRHRRLAPDPEGALSLFFFFLCDRGGPPTPQALRRARPQGARNADTPWRGLPTRHRVEGGPIADPGSRARKNAQQRPPAGPPLRKPRVPPRGADRSRADRIVPRPFRNRPLPHPRALSWKSAPAKRLAHRWSNGAEQWTASAGTRDRSGRTASD